MKKYNQYIKEQDTNVIPITKMNIYTTWYKKWCEEHGIEPDFDLKKPGNVEKIIHIAKEYAEDNNLPNMTYYQSSE